MSVIETTTAARPPKDIRPVRSPFLAALSLPEIRWAALATVLFAVGAVAQVAGAPEVVWWSLYLACYAAGGWEPALAGLQALREKTLDVDLLMIVAALVAASIGQIFEGALLIVIFATSGALEAFATRRTEDSVNALLTLAPERAVRLSKSGEEEDVDAETLVVGDLVLVRPGERVGADGEILNGVSELDQASITGEPLPVTKGPGDEVFAGTLNGAGALRVRVHRAAADTVIARIVAMVEQASSSKAKTQLFIEKIEQRYSVGVVVATLALFTIPLVFGAEFEPTLLRAMTFMIVASPCAVVLATMPPLLATIANAGRHGVLVKSAVALEELSKVDLVAFDKTGTLTQGTPRVASVVTFGDTSEAELLRVAAAAERRSEHPVGRAIVAAARERSIEFPEPDEFGSTPGRGVDARVEGRSVTIGAPSPLLPADERQAQAAVAELERSGHTAVVVLVDERVIGVVALTDRVRDGAQSAVRSLTDLTGNEAVLLTGDNQPAAERLAHSVGITRVEAHLLPADKVTAVKRLRTGGHQVLLVGDGVNDAPAMAAAHVGVAMGRNGSDLAMETSDVVLVRDDLAALPKTIDLARRAHRVVKANLVIAGTVITVLVAWDIFGTLPLPLGVAGHEGSTIIVALNGLRLLRKSAWQKAGTAPATPTAAVTGGVSSRQGELRRGA